MKSELIALALVALVAYALATCLAVWVFAPWLANAVIWLLKRLGCQ